MVPILRAMLEEAGPVEEAEALVNDVLRLARAHDNKALLEIASDPRTDPLLRSLQTSVAKQAETHLRGARVWRAKQNKKARDKFDAASKALDELDLVLARGILRKIDTSLLDEDGVERYDELLLAVSARSIELEEIQSQLPDVPSDAGSRRGRWFRRR